MSPKSTKPRCAAIVWSDALRKERQCQNWAGASGFCTRHAQTKGGSLKIVPGILVRPGEKKEGIGPPVGFKPTQKAVGVGIEDAGGQFVGSHAEQGPPAELVLARRVILAAREWLRDPEKKGRFVAVLGDYEETYGLVPSGTEGS